MGPHEAGRLGRVLTSITASSIVPKECVGVFSSAFLYYFNQNADINRFFHQSCVQSGEEGFKKQLHGEASYKLDTPCLSKSGSSSAPGVSFQLQVLRSTSVFTFSENLAAPLPKSLSDSGTSKPYLKNPPSSSHRPSDSSPSWLAKDPVNPRLSREANRAPRFLSSPWVLTPARRKQGKQWAGAQSFHTRAAACFDFDTQVKESQVESTPAANALPTSAAPYDLQRLVYGKLDQCTNVVLLKETLEQYDAYLDEMGLSKVLEKAALLPLDQRRVTSKGFQEVMKRASAVYMQLLPNMDPVRSVALLHTLAFLGAKMHEPHQCQEGYALLSKHMAEQVTPVLLRMDADSTVVNMLWALSKHSHHRELPVDEELFHSIAQYLVGKLPTMPLKQLSKIAQAYAMVRINEWSLMDHICRLAYNRLSTGDIDYATVSNLIDALAKLGIQNDNLFSLVISRLMMSASRLKAHQLVALCKAFGELRVEDEGLWSCLTEQLKRVMNDVSSSQLTSLTWAFSKRGVVDQSVYGAIATRAQAILPTFSASDLPALMYCLGKPAMVPKALMSQLGAVSIERMSSMTLRNVSNLVWGFARLGHEDLAPFRAASDRAKAWLKDPEGRLVLSRDQEVETFLDEDGRLVERRQDPATLQTIESIHCKSGNIITVNAYPLGRKCFISQNLSDLAWALADRGAADEELFGLIAQRAVETIRSFTRTSLVDLIWAFAHAGIYHKELFDALEVHTLAILAELGPLYVAEVMWAFARVQHPMGEELKQAVMDISWSRWQRTSSDQGVLAQLTWSLLQLNADKTQPNHPLLLEIKKLLSQAQEDTPDSFDRTA